MLLPGGKNFIPYHTPDLLQYTSCCPIRWCLCCFSLAQNWTTMPCYFLLFKFTSCCPSQNGSSSSTTDVLPPENHEDTLTHHSPRFGTVIPNRIFVGGIDYKVRLTKSFVIGPVDLTYVCPVALLQQLTSQRFQNETSRARLVPLVK